MSGLPLNIDWQQILLHLFNFAILAGGLYLLLYTPVKKFMAKREDYYKEMDEEAITDRQEAAELKKEYKEKLEHFEEEMDRRRDEVEEEIEKMRQEHIKYANDEAEIILERARNSAKREHDQMINNYTNEIKEMAVNAAQKAMLKNHGDPYEEFLELAERSMHSEHID